MLVSWQNNDNNSNFQDWQEISIIILIYQKLGLIGPVQQRIKLLLPDR